MKVKELIERLQECNEDAEVELQLLYDSYAQKIDIIFDATAVNEVNSRFVRIEGFM